MNTQVTNQPTLIVDSDAREPGLVGVTVWHLGTDLRASLGRDAQVGGLLQSLLRVSVRRTGAPSDDNRFHFIWYEVSGRCSVGS